MRIDVRDNHNLIIGYVDDIGDRIIATHIRKGYVGAYVKSTNLTLNKSGKIYCYGDGTQSLVRDTEAESKGK